MWWKLSSIVGATVALAATLGGSNVMSGHDAYIASVTENATLAQASGLHSSVMDPDALYHKVWQLISDDFYDDKFSGQSWARWEHKYDGKLKTMDDSHVAIETMLASLADPYTRFLDKDAFDDEKQQIDAHLCGIGVQIGPDPKTHRIMVIAPIEGTPAERAGLCAGDEITDINGKSTKGWGVEEAAKQIRGKIDTECKLGLLRGKEHLKVVVLRAEIPIKAVSTAKMLDNSVGYIRLTSFISQAANTEMRDALIKLSGAKGIILDLRQNPGGLLTNAIDISNLFLDSGNIVSTVDRDGYVTPAECDKRPVCKVPLVVLIDKHSASASEITSGALRDNNRATLVGQTTYGKGLVQGINRLEDGSGVNITIAKYLTPKGDFIHKKGIGPDVAVTLTEDDLKAGKGPWWMDNNDPTEKRQPEDLRDMQLKAAMDVAHKKIDGVFQGDNPVALKPQPQK
ncbi:MAG TPA: S41 family peptidase [Planktothrix sp.]|jgi:carboxyl-terminal processing protease